MMDPIVNSQPIPLKKVPCNGCREKKRKCSYGQPCTRCAKNGTECIYIMMPSPKDLEYMQELEYINQMESIQYQIACMEKEIGILKLAQENQSKITDYPSPVSLENSSMDQDIAPKETLVPKLPTPEFVDFTTKDDREHFIQHMKQISENPHHTLLCANEYQAEIEKQKAEPWVLTVKNGEMTIHTKITSHSQLLTNMSSMLNSSIYQKTTKSIPFPFYQMPIPQTSAFETVISIMVWRKYGKTRFKSYAQYSPRLLFNEPIEQVNTVIPVEGLTTITLRLIATYFQCKHFDEFGLYQPAFIKLYMTGDIFKSPAVMGLCTMICLKFCKHLLNVLPMEALPEYAQYYFEQTKSLIEDRFDDMDMETMLTYCYMATYKFKMAQVAEGQRYLQMAERIYEILKPDYLNESCQSDETVLFNRFYRMLFRIRSTTELLRVMDEKERYRIGHHQLFTILDNEHYPIVRGPEDTPKEIQFIQMKTYLAKIRKVIKEGGRCAVAPDYPTFISVFGHHIEMSLRHWYKTILPNEFKLSLPLFEDHVDDLSFFTTLEKECADSPLALLMTINVYNEYLVMAKSYVPKDPKAITLKTEDLIRQFKQMQYDTRHGLNKEYEIDCKEHHWLKVISKMRYYKQYNKHQFSGEEWELSDDEFFTNFIKVLNPSKLNFDMPIIHTSVKTALNMVRFSQFLISRDYACFFDARWIFNAWDILTRAAIFKYQQPDDKSVTLDRIRANLIVCLDIIRNYTEFSSRNPNTPILDSLEQEFYTCFAL